MSALGLLKDGISYGIEAMKPWIVKNRWFYHRARNRCVISDPQLLQKFRLFDSGKPISHLPDLALVATGTSLCLIKDRQLLSVFRSGLDEGRFHKATSRWLSAGYFFGVTLVNDRVYFSHLIQQCGNAKHSEETFRYSQLYSAKVSDLQGCTPGAPVEARLEHEFPGELVSGLNAKGDTLYAVGYLGGVHTFEVLDDGTLRRSNSESILKFADGLDLLNYSYAHCNAISVGADDTVYVGSHQRKRYTGRNSRIYALKDGRVHSWETDHVHAHDIVVADGAVYGLDSKGRRLTRNLQPLYQHHEGFLRGLSIGEKTVTFGVSGVHANREDRNKSSAGSNYLVVVHKETGQFMHRISLVAPQIYQVRDLAPGRDLALSHSNTSDFNQIEAIVEASQRPARRTCLSPAR